MTFEKFFAVLMVAVLLLVPINDVSAINNNLYGDLDNSTTFNGIDLILLRRYLMGAAPSYVSANSADMTLDNCVNVQDLVRMKKYFVGDVIHINQNEESFTWTIFEGEDDFPIVTAVSFRFNTTCTVRTNCLPGRYTTEVSAFIKTDKNINPELDSPEINISQTSINNESLSIMYSDDTIVSPKWIWKYAVADPSIDVSSRSIFSSLFTIMISKSYIPYREFKNSFVF